MKKLLFIFLLAGGVTACGNNNTETTEDRDTLAAPVTPGIDNVNGSIPDTGETIRLNTPLPTDSLTGSPADSTR